MTSLLVTYLALSVAAGELVWNPHDPLPTRPFLSVWNAPVFRCSQKYGIDLDLSAFDFVVNPDRKWVGQFMTIFYSDHRYSNQIGLYPYYTDDGQAVNGGVPQLVNMQQHLAKARSDIVRMIPDPDYAGLAVIDWERWKPLWERNWDKKAIYQKASEEVVRKLHPDWNATRVANEAQHQFEASGRAMMEQTLHLARQIRPRGHWGYYAFPDCFNYGGQRVCDSATKHANDRLAWLFNASSTIFPSAYLYGTNVTKHTNFAYGQIMEALRVSGKVSPGGATLPIFLYSRYEYADDLGRGYYIKEDVSTVLRQASDLGVTGIIFWGNGYSQNSSSTCRRLKKFIDTTLGPLVKEVTELAVSCSTQLCHNHGRCVKMASIAYPQQKTQYLKDFYYNYSKLKDNVFHLVQRLSYRYNYGRWPEDSFPGYSCRCYAGWSGTYCDQPYVTSDWDSVIGTI